MTADASGAKRSLGLRLAMAGTALLLCGGIAAFFYAAQRGAKPRPGQQVETDIAIAITERSCEPAEVTVAAGKASFLVTNRSERVLEWEILDGVMVVDERENIAPGLSRRLTTQLHPGEYAITCGLLSAPRGKLIVRASGAAAPAKLSLMDVVGPVAEYRVYLLAQAEALTTAVDQLRDAVEAGSAEATAQNLGAANAAFQRLRPALTADELKAGPIADLASALAATGHQASEAATPTLAGSAASLPDKARTLAAALAGRTVLPEAMIDGAAQAVGTLAQAGTDSAARTAGIRKIVELLRPLVARLDSPLAAKTAADLGAVEHELGTRRDLATAVEALAGDLAAMKVRLALDSSGKTP